MLCLYIVFDQVRELYITLLTLALVVFVDNFTFHSTTDKLQHYNTKRKPQAHCLTQHTAQSTVAHQSAQPANMGLLSFSVVDT